MPVFQREQGSKTGFSLLDTVMARRTDTKKRDSPSNRVFVALGRGSRAYWTFAGLSHNANLRVNSESAAREEYSAPIDFRGTS